MTWIGSEGLEEYHGEVSLYPGQWTKVSEEQLAYLVETFPDRVKVK